MDEEMSDIIIANLQQQLNELRAEVRDRPRAESTPSVIINKEPAPITPVLFRPSDLPKYDGSEDLYPAWRRAVLDTLGME